MTETWPPKQSRDDLHQLLELAASKIERGIVLPKGTSQDGRARYTEADTVVAVLRNLASGRDYARNLLRAGPPPKSWGQTLREFEEARAKHGTAAAAYKAIAKAKGRKVSAVEKEVKRARQVKRDLYARLKGKEGDK